MDDGGTGSPGPPSFLGPGGHSGAERAEAARERRGGSRCRAQGEGGPAGASRTLPPHLSLGVSSVRLPLTHGSSSLFKLIAAYTGAKEQVRQGLGPAGPPFTPTHSFPRPPHLSSLSFRPPSRRACLSITLVRLRVFFQE